GRAIVTAVVMLSPVNFDSSSAIRRASRFLIFSPIFYLSTEKTIDLSTIGERAVFENISRFGFVLAVQFMLAHSIIAIARAPLARLVEGSNGKFAPRQRSPFIAIHR